MNGELAGSLDDSLTQSLTPVETQASDCDNVSCKRFRVTQVNGFIVYSRAKKCRFSNSDGLLENDINGKRIKIKLNEDRSNQVVELENVVNKNGLVESVIEENPLFEYVMQKNQQVKMVVENLTEEVETIESKEGNCMCKEETISELDSCLVEGGGSEETSLVRTETSDVKNDLNKNDLKWLAPKLEPELEPFEVLVTQSEGFGNDALSLIEVEAIAEGSALLSPNKKLELKMLKKIALNKKPMTVTELFETGLLDGVSVIYMGGIKASGLRGTIKDGGILCSCSLCNGCRVIPPSKFEIHACKQYRRASQYICFENGKSLLEVLRACRSVPLSMLEATLQSALSSLPEEKSFACVRCKGTFPITCVGKTGPGPLCNLCVKSKKPQGNLTCITGIKPRSSKPELFLKSSKSVAVCISSHNKRERKKTRKLLEADMGSKPFSKSASLRNILKNKSPWEITTNSSKPGFLTSSSTSTLSHISLRNQKQRKITKKSKKTVLISKPFKNPSVPISSPTKSQWKIMKRDQRLHKLVFGEGGLPDGTEVGYYAREQKLLEGYKNGSGIICCCCNSEVSPSQFEAHAGWASRRKPYAYIYTSNGVSLAELAISISKGCKYSAKDNDDLGIIGADGENLLPCNGCPRAFHKECASLSSAPRGGCYCNYCQNMFEREELIQYNAHTVVAGRLSGVDPIEQITKRCIRIVKNLEAELSGCVLCRGSDFSKSGFGPRTILLCDQCEKEFHVGCLKKHKMADLRELPKGKWFCSVDCSRISSVLQNLLVHEAEKLPEFYLNAIKKKHAEKGLETSIDIDVRWRLLSGKAATPETRLLLSQAIAIFHDCFDPIVDSMSGRDLIPSMVYGRKLRGQEFGGMYCAILTINSSVVSAGVLRVFGQEVAELPLVATSKINHSKGYFQLLFSCIEKLLSFLHVRSLVLPAAEEAESIWTEKFGFKKIEPEQLSIYRKNCSQMVTFKGTCMLQKTVPAYRFGSFSTDSTECVSGVEVESWTQS